MAAVTKNIDKYLLSYIGGKSLDAGEAGALIDCYYGNVRVARITFFKDGLTIPANQVLGDGTLSLYYQMSRFNDFITTLRYEKPLMLVVNSSNGFGYLGTSVLEGVGEQEGV